MKNIKTSLLTLAGVAFLFACNQKPSQKTGQENGLNTIDSTKNQTSGFTAPGSPPDTSNDNEHSDSSLSAPPTNQAPASGNPRP